MRRTQIAIFVLLAVSLVFGLLFARQVQRSGDLPRLSWTKKKIRVLTYSTFVSASGPGPEIIKNFETRLNCDIEVTTQSDAGLLLERLKIAESRTPFDLVIGLDQLLLEAAERQFRWQPIAAPQTALVGYVNPHFAPLDWSPLTFIYRKGEFSVPTTFAELLNPAHARQFALQDPRSSSPGLQFFHWVKAVQGADTLSFLERFAPNVHSVSPNWTFAYGLFKKNQTRFVFSYLTSLAFHWGHEGQRDYQAVNIQEGHPVQVEYAAIPATCRECELAQKLVTELQTPAAQKIIMEKNFMFPVIKGVSQGTIFQELPELKIRPTGTGKDLREWDQVFRR